MRSSVNRSIDFTSSPYCKLCRYLLTVLGQWPDQKASQRVFIVTVFGVLYVIGISTQALKLIKNITELEQITASLPPLITTLVTFTKLITFILNRENIKKMFDQLNDDWKTINFEKEMQVFEQYLKNGNLYSIGYCILIYITIVTFILLIFDSYLFDMVAPLNESRPLKTIYPADYYFLDEKEHFLLINCHMIIGSCVLVAVLTAADTTLIIFIQYACAMYSILGNRLESTLYERNSEKETLIGHQKEIYTRRIVECVFMHRKTLDAVSYHRDSIMQSLSNLPIFYLVAAINLFYQRFVRIMEFTYSIPHLIQLLINIICLSVTLLQVVLLWGQLEVIRYILYTIAQVFHIFYVSYQGQQLIDHSAQVSNKIYSGSWYETPKEIQKLLLFMLKKSATDSRLTAGKMIDFSMETFNMIVQNSMSYFMVFASLR